jgi:hypothetical protein
MSDASALPSLLDEYKDAKITPEEVCVYLFKLVEAEDDVTVRKTLLAKAIEKNAEGQPANALAGLMLLQVGIKPSLPIRIKIAVNTVRAPLQPADYGSHTSSPFRVSLPPVEQMRSNDDPRIDNSPSL